MVSAPGQPVILARLAGRSKTNGATPMPIRLERWMRSKLSVMTARTPSSLGPSPPSRGWSRCRIPCRRSRRPARLRRDISSPRRRSTSSSPRRMMDRVAAFGAAHHLVPDADIGEGAAHHHFVIAAARAVGIEIRDRDAVFEQVTARRAVLLDRAGRRDVVGGDGIAEQRQDARALDLVDRRRRFAPCRRNRAGSSHRSRPGPRHRSCPS